MGLFNLGDFTLHSGAKTRWKIDCESLTVSDLRALAFMSLQLLSRRFGGVIGVPQGGLMFAEALKLYSSPPGPWLVVDDVLTTGSSMEEVRKTLVEVDGPTMGVVIFARGPCPPWVTPIFWMTEPKEGYGAP